MKKIPLLLVLNFALISSSLHAQIEIGASYELRDEDPKSGFGVRIQKDFLKPLPLVSLGLRAYASFFHAENNVSENGFSYSQDLTNYDIGLAVISGVSVGLIEPYIGLGLGSTTLNIKKDEYSIFIPDDEEPMDVNESNIYWNGLVGAKVAVIPILKPFVEFRYSNTSLSKPEEAELTTGIIIFGVALSF